MPGATGEDAPKGCTRTHVHAPVRASEHLPALPSTTLQQRVQQRPLPAQVATWPLPPGQAHAHHSALAVHALRLPVVQLPAPEPPACGWQPCSTCRACSGTAAALLSATSTSGPAHRPTCCS